MACIRKQALYPRFLCPEIGALLLKEIPDLPVQYGNLLLFIRILLHPMLILIPAVFRRSNPVFRHKSPVQGGRIRKPALKSGMQNRHVLHAKKLPGMRQPDIREQFSEILPKSFFYETGKISFGKISLGGKIPKTDLFLIVFFQVPADRRLSGDSGPASSLLAPRFRNHAVHAQIIQQLIEGSRGRRGLLLLQLPVAAENPHQPSADPLPHFPVLHPAAAADIKMGKVKVGSISGIRDQDSSDQALLLRLHGKMLIGVDNKIICHIQRCFFVSNRNQSSSAQDEQDSGIPVGLRNPETFIKYPQFHRSGKHRSLSAPSV